MSFPGSVDLDFIYQLEFVWADSKSFKFVICESGVDGHSRVGLEEERERRCNSDC
jgi:hypothetical protein